MLALDALFEAGAIDKAFCGVVEGISLVIPS